MGKVNGTTGLKHQYNFFDQYHQLQSRHLNIFQRVLRNVFGRYASTHLTTVVRKAYSVTLNDQFQGNAEKKAQLLNLFAKADRGFSQLFFNLPEYKLANGTKVVPSIHYGLTSDKTAVSYIDFKFNFTGPGLPSIREVSIFKIKPNSYVAQFQDDLNLASEWFIDDRYSSVQAKAVNDFVAKIINDASQNPNFSELRRYIPNYSQMQNTHEQTDYHKIAYKVETAIEELGWEYLTAYERENKLIYLFRKEKAALNQELSGLGYNQSLSLNFAISALETQAHRFN